MAITPVDICNDALISLGQDPITTLEDNTKAAQLCNTMYPFIRDEMLRSVPWRRLKERANLAYQAGVTPAWQYKYSFLTPSDMITLLDVWVGGAPFRKGWELEGNAIVTNVVGPLQIRYIRDSNNPDEWDSLMRRTISLKIALDLAEPLTQDSTKVQQAGAKFALVEKRAKHENSQEGNSVPMEQPDPWVTARYAGSANEAILRPISES